MMNQLVFVENNKVVTDSLTIAEVFRKEHKHVLRDIETQLEKLKEAGEEEWGVSNFGLTQYQHLQNKQWYPKYNLTEEAFTIVAMSYTTPEAMKMKVRFIQEFKRMREFIQQPKPLSEIEQLKAAMRLSLATSEEIETLKVDVHEVKSEVEQLKDSIHITSSQAKALRKKVGEKVYEALGGRETNAFKHLKNKTFSACWNEFKNYFDINEYRELPKNKFEEGMKFLLMWQPKTELRLEIEHYNTQLKFHLIENKNLA